MNWIEIEVTLVHVAESWDGIGEEDEINHGPGSKVGATGGRLEQERVPAVLRRRSPQLPPSNPSLSVPFCPIFFDRRTPTCTPHPGPTAVP